jgi:hypothetical protein
MAPGTMLLRLVRTVFQLDFDALLICRVAI